MADGWSQRTVRAPGELQWSGIENVTHRDRGIRLHALSGFNSTSDPQHAQRSWIQPLDAVVGSVARPVGLPS